MSRHALLTHRTPRRGARRIAAVALATAGLLATGGGVATAADPYTACRGGQQDNYVDPATNQPFTADGRGMARCIVTLAHGGELISVLPPLSVEWQLNPYAPGLTDVYALVQVPSAGRYAFTVMNAGGSSPRRTSTRRPPGRRRWGSACGRPARN